MHLLLNIGDFPAIAMLVFGWWFQLFYIFTANLGEDSNNFAYYFSKWVVETIPTRKLEGHSLRALKLKGLRD